MASIFHRQTEDLISNVPGIVTDKILEHLPIQMAARTSALSKHWRCNWLSLKCLIFDFHFFDGQSNEDGNCNWQECSNIISSILLHHKGPIHEFIVHIPEGADEDGINVSQWLSFLSEHAVKRIELDNWFNDISMPSYIFWCSELEQLDFSYFTLNPPPTSFGGFMKLKRLLLLSIEFTQPDVLLTFLGKCPMLATLSLEKWSGMARVVIDVPSLETLTVSGMFESLAFGDFQNLKTISVNLEGKPTKSMTMDTYDAIDHLASSSQLQSIQFNGHLCQYLDAGRLQRPSIAFNHLKKLFLSDLDLRDLCAVFIFDMIKNCPYIEKLDISFTTTRKAIDPKFDYVESRNLDHLFKVKITGIMGTNAELKLIEYLLAISSVLEELSFKCGELDTESELKMSRALMRFPRASTKARLVCLI